jgi:hypothetical protein
MPSKNAEYARNKRAHGLSRSAPSTRWHSSQSFVRFGIVEQSQVEFFDFMQNGPYEARIYILVCSDRKLSVSKTEDGSDDLKAAAKCRADILYPRGLYGRRLPVSDVLYPGPKKHIWFLAWLIYLGNFFTELRMVVSWTHHSFPHFRTSESARSIDEGSLVLQVFIQKYRSEARLPRGIHRVLYGRHVLREALGSSHRPRVASGFGSQHDHLKAIIHIKPNVVEVKVV